MTFKEIRIRYLTKMLAGHCTCIIEYYGYCPWCFLMNSGDKMLSLEGIEYLRKHWQMELAELEKGD